jgi:hypothetical protein
VEQDDVVRYVLDALEHLRVPHAVVGSFASGAWGEPRTTHDVDIVVRFTETEVREFCSFFPPPDWYVSLPAALEALRRRKQFNVIHTTSGFKADLMISSEDEWGRQQLDRRIRFKLLPDRDAYTAHPEDVILGKLRYYQEGSSDKHLRDIAGMLEMSGELIDRKQVTAWAERLGVLDVWKTVLDRVDHGDRSNC